MKPMTRIAENRDADAAWLVQIARDWLERAEGREPRLDLDVPDNPEATRRAIRNVRTKEGAAEEVGVEEGQARQRARSLGNPGVKRKRAVGAQAGSAPSGCSGGTMARRVAASGGSSLRTVSHTRSRSTAA